MWTAKDTIQLNGGCAKIGTSPVKLSLGLWVYGFVHQVARLGRGANLSMAITKHHG